MEFFPVYERTIHKGQRIPERRYHMKGRRSQRPESKSTYQPFSLTSSGSFMMGSLARTITGGSSVGFAPILNGSQATRGQGLSTESATRRRRRSLLTLALSFYSSGSDQDVPEDHGDCQNQRLGVNQVRKNGGRGGRSLVHEDYGVGE